PPVVESDSNSEEEANRSTSPAAGNSHQDVSTKPPARRRVHVVVSPLPRIRILSAPRPSDRWRLYYRRKGDLGERRLQSRWLSSRLIPHRHRPGAELKPAYELQVDMLR